MTAYLLDVNVLIALVNPEHIQHDRAHAWFAGVGHRAFATCPLTEDGLIRIIGHPKYPNSPGPPSAALRSLIAIRGLPGHRFWPDDISIADATYLAPELLSSHARVTDSYLLASHMHMVDASQRWTRSWPRRSSRVARRHWL